MGSAIWANILVFGFSLLWCKRVVKRRLFSRERGIEILRNWRNSNGLVTANNYCSLRKGIVCDRVVGCTAGEYRCACDAKER